MELFLCSDVPQISGNKVSSGVPILDQRLHGGFLEKSFIYFGIDSNYNFKYLTHYLVNAHKVLYITTNKSPENIIKDIERIGLSAEDDIFISVFDEYLNIKPSEYSPEMDLDIIQFLEDEIEMFRSKKGKFSDCDDDWIIVVDTVSFFLNLEHVEKHHKLHLMKQLNDVTQELNTLCYALVLKDAQQGPNKELEIVLKDMCNVIIDSKVTTNVNGEITSVINIPKIYGEEISTFVM